MKFHPGAEIIIPFDGLTGIRTSGRVTRLLTVVDILYREADSILVEIRRSIDPGADEPVFNQLPKQRLRQQSSVSTGRPGGSAKVPGSFDRD